MVESSNTEMLHRRHESTESSAGMVSTIGCCLLVTLFFGCLFLFSPFGENSLWQKLSEQQWIAPLAFVIMMLSCCACPFLISKCLHKERVPTHDREWLPGGSGVTGPAYGSSRTALGSSWTSPVGSRLYTRHETSDFSAETIGCCLLVCVSLCCLLGLFLFWEKFSWLGQKILEYEWPGLLFLSAVGVLLCCICPFLSKYMQKEHVPVHEREWRPDSSGINSAAPRSPWTGFGSPWAAPGRMPTVPNRNRSHGGDNFCFVGGLLVCFTICCGIGWYLLSYALHQMVLLY